MQFSDFFLVLYRLPARKLNAVAISLMLHPIVKSQFEQGKPSPTLLRFFPFSSQSLLTQASAIFLCGGTLFAIVS